MQYTQYNQTLLLDDAPYPLFFIRWDSCTWSDGVLYLRVDEDLLSGYKPDNTLAWQVNIKQAQAILRMSHVHIDLATLLKIQMELNHGIQPC